MKKRGRRSAGIREKIRKFENASLRYEGENEFEIAAALSERAGSLYEVLALRSPVTSLDDRIDALKCYRRGSDLHGKEGKPVRALEAETLAQKVAAGIVADSENRKAEFLGRIKVAKLRR